MQIEKVKISSLILDPANARKHNQKNLEAIKGSLAKFGQQKVVVVDENNIVIAGNGTVQEAKALGWTEIVVNRTDLRGTDKTAFAIADNRTGELAEWDDDVLSKTLEGLKEGGFDLDSIGFDEKDFLKFSFGEIVADKDEPKNKQSYEVNTVNKKIKLLMGFKTAMTRDSASAPIAHYKANGLLTGEVLDFGSGMDKHEFTKYDPYYQFTPRVLQRKYDTITCNYVLNVQAHVGARMNTLLAVRALLNQNGKALFAVMTSGDNGGDEKLVRSSKGFQVYFSRESWEAEIKTVFTYVKRVKAPFVAWECSVENI